MERIGELFAIEPAASEAGDSPPERGQRRLREARPILDAFRAWCEERLRELLPKSPTALAIGYTLEHWAALTRYLDDGAIAIDNNAAERALREIAVGRKNWLFAGSERGGEACAIVTSLIETAKAHGHDQIGRAHV